MDDAFAPLVRSLASFGGRAGIVVAEADGRELFAVAPDEPMLAASVIKLPLAMALFADAADGLLDLGERLEIGDYVDGSGVLRDLGVSDLTLRDFATLALTVSDNTAANRLIERMGMARVNEWLAEWGCPTSRLERAMFDYEAKSRGCENRMTARETAALLLRLVNGELVDAPTSSAVVGILRRNEDRSRLGRYLPGSIGLAHKGGWMEGVDDDAGVIFGERPIVAAAFINDGDAAHARSLLGLVGWCAARASGADLEPLPFELRGL